MPVGPASSQSYQVAGRIRRNNFHDWNCDFIHVPPDARLESGASGIAGSLSSAPNMAQAGHGKSLRFRHLQFG